MKQKLATFGEWALKGTAFGLPIALYLIAVFAVILARCELGELKSQLVDLGFGPGLADTTELIVADTFSRRDPSSIPTSPENGQALDILGTISNPGEYSWNNIWIKIDFFDHDGAFIDQATEHVAGVLPPRGVLHFKVSTRSIFLSVPEAAIKDFKIIVSQGTPTETPAQLPGGR